MNSPPKPRADRRVTRGRPGRIESGPRAVKERVDRGLRDGETQRRIREETAPMLAAHGEPPLSAGGLSGYAARVERSGRRIRVARAAADVWAERFGSAGEGNVGRFTRETIEALTLDATLAAEEGVAEGEPPSLEMLRELSLISERNARSAEIDARRERTVRAAMAAEAETAAVAVGLSEDTAARIRAAIEGAAP